MKAMNQIPDELFGLIESKSWLELNNHEKNMVLGYLSEEEFTKMHEVFLATTELNARENEMDLPAAIKHKLDQQFKVHHQKGAMIPLWQAAAVFLVLLSGFLFYAITQNRSENKIVNIIHDTLYVPQYVETQSKKTDTVIVYRYKENNKQGFTSKYDVQKDMNNTSEQAVLPVAQIRALSIEEIKSSIKNIKNKSMLEDTLYRKIGYASI